jgi:hypothetical protein
LKIPAGTYGKNGFPVKTTSMIMFSSSYPNSSQWRIVLMTSCSQIAYPAIKVRTNIYNLTEIKTVLDFNWLEHTGKG